MRHGQGAASKHGGREWGAATAATGAANGSSSKRGEDATGSRRAPNPAPADDPLHSYRPSQPALLEPYRRLGALLPGAPVPMKVLQRLWQMASADAAMEAADALAADGVLRLATLADGSTWGMLDEQHRAHVTASWPRHVEAAHALLLASYEVGALAGQLQRRQPAPRSPLATVLDDGYIMKALPHHLLAAGRPGALCALLCELAWLETKVYAYGVGGLMSDFRRCIRHCQRQLQQQQHKAEGQRRQQRQDSDGCGCSDDGNFARCLQMLQMLLQALQLSLGSASKHPKLWLLREQLLARLLAASATCPEFKAWHADQSARCVFDRQGADASRRPLHLMAKSASLQQAGGPHCMTMRSPGGAALRRVLLLPTKPNNIVTTCTSGTAQLWDLSMGDCVAELRCASRLSAEAVSPDGATVVLGTQDGVGCMWDLAAGRAVHTLRGHTARINAIAVDKQGLRCVTGSDDGTARVWSMWGGACEEVLEGHGGPGGAGGAVLGVAISSDGVLCVTASEDFSARVWGLDEEGECLRTLEGHAGWVTACAFVGTSQDVVTASHDMTARLWDAVSGRCLRVLEGHSGRLNQVVVDVGGHVAVTCSDDGSARVWDADTGDCLQVLSGHQGHVADAAVSRDAKTVVTVSGDGRAAVWELATGSRRAWLEGHSDEATSVALSQHLTPAAPSPQKHCNGVSSGQLAVTCSIDGTVRVWDLDLASLPAVASHKGRVSGLAPLPGGRGWAVSAGDDGRVMAWDASTGECLAQREGHGAGVRFLSAAADGRHVVSGSGDRKVCKWNWDACPQHGAASEWEAQELPLLSNAHAISASTTGRRSLPWVPGGDTPLGASPPSGTPSMQLAADDMHLIGTLAGLGLGACAGGADAQALPGLQGGAAPAPAALAPVVPKAVSVSAAAAELQADACVCGTPTSHMSLLRQATTTTTTSSLLSMQSEPLRSTLPAQQGSRVKSMAFDSACRYSAVLLYDSTVGVWDLDSGVCVRQIIKRGERDAARTHSGGVNAVYMTADASKVVTVSKDCTARVWDVASGATLLLLQGHTDGVAMAGISPDQALLATASYDRSVRVSFLGPPPEGGTPSVGTARLMPRAVPGGTLLAVLDHGAPAAHLAFSPDGRRLAVALEDNTLVLWDLKHRRCLEPISEHTAAINAIAWSDDSGMLLTASEDCTLRAWRAADGKALALFAADASVTSCCFCSGTAPNSTIVAGDAKGAVHFLDVPEELQR